MDAVLRAGFAANSTQMRMGAAKVAPNFQLDAGPNEVHFDLGSTSRVTRAGNSADRPLRACAPARLRACTRRAGREAGRRHPAAVHAAAARRRHRMSLALAFLALTLLTTALFRSRPPAAAAATTTPAPPRRQRWAPSLSVSEEDEAGRRGAQKDARSHARGGVPVLGAAREEMHAMHRARACTAPPDATDLVQATVASEGSASNWWDDKDAGECTREGETGGLTAACTATDGGGRGRRCRGAGGSGDESGGGSSRGGRSPPASGHSHAGCSSHADSGDESSAAGNASGASLLRSSAGLWRSLLGGFVEDFASLHGDAQACLVSRLHQIGDRAAAEELWSSLEMRRSRAGDEHFSSLISGRGGPPRSRTFFSGPFQAGDGSDGGEASLSDGCGDSARSTSDGSESDEADGGGTGDDDDGICGPTALDSED
jgi:hypothetical protein